MAMPFCTAGRSAISSFQRWEMPQAVNLHSRPFVATHLHQFRKSHAFSFVSFLIKRSFVSAGNLSGNRHNHLTRTYPRASVHTGASNLVDALFAASYMQDFPS